MFPCVKKSESGLMEEALSTRLEKKMRIFSCGRREPITKSIFLILFLSLLFAAGAWGEIIADLDGDNRVDLDDWVIFAWHWGDTNCAEANNCDGADFEPNDGVVDTNDLAKFVKYWLDVVPVDVNAVFYSIKNEDGRVWDNNDGEGLGADSGGSGSSALALGDFASGVLHVGYRSVLSFDTSLALPLDCNLLSVQLELVRGNEVGTDPFAWGGSCVIDIADAYFGSGPNLEPNDWEAAADAYAVASFASDPGPNQPMLSTEFNTEGSNNLNLDGKTQFKVYFENPTNYDTDSDCLGFYSGEQTDENRKPKLKVRYRSRRPIEMFNSDAAEDGRIYAIYSGGIWVANGAVADDNSGTALRLGDYESTSKYAYRNIVSFDTNSLPDDCVILSARLQLTRSTKNGDDPFLGWGGACMIDIASPYFGSSSGLQTADWDAAADANAVANFVADPGADQPMLSTEFSAKGLENISKSGFTQLRIYFQEESNLDQNTDCLYFYAGDDTDYEKQPKLIIQYIP
jgi:hypothetical protein